MKILNEVWEPIVVGLVVCEVIVVFHVIDVIPLHILWVRMFC